MHQIGDEGVAVSLVGIVMREQAMMVKSVPPILGSFALVLICGNQTLAVDCNSNGVDDTTDISGSTSYDLDSSSGVELI